MDFSLTFEQQALVESISAFVEKELYPHEAIVEELRAVPEEIAARHPQQGQGGRLITP